MLVVRVDFIYISGTLELVFHHVILGKWSACCSLCVSVCMWLF